MIEEIFFFLTDNSMISELSLGVYTTEMKETPSSSYYSMLEGPDRNLRSQKKDEEKGFPVIGQ